MTQKSERAQQLVNYVRDEIERYKSGELNRFSLNEDLRKKFGYAYDSSFYTVLKSRGLVGYREKTTSEKLCEIPLPSQNLSWMLGILAGSGSVDTDTGRIILRSKEENLSSSFQNIGEREFKVNSTQRLHTIEKDGKTFESMQIQFSNTKAARFLGDLRQSEWPQTLIEKHRWVIQDQKFTWSFIEGFFEVRGGIYTYDRENDKARHQILLKTSSRVSANTLAEMLTHLGLQNHRVRFCGNTKEGIDGVEIGSLNDINVFSCNIHSLIPEKEERLEYYRDKKLESGYNQIHSEKKLIKEWERIYILLGHNPSSPEIIALKKQNKTDCSVSTFARRFGGGSFLRARENLERISAERKQSGTPQTINLGGNEKQIIPGNR